MFKLQVTLLVAVVAVAVDGGLIASAPAQVVRQELDAYPLYNYGYSVQDPLSGDIKSQEESRDGEVVRGRYSLVEPDGTLRIVTYFADHTGFHSVVQYQRPGYSAPVQQVKPVVVQQPQPVHVQVPLPPPAPVQVVHFHPQPQPVEVIHEAQPVEVVHQPAPQPQPQPVIEEVFQPQPQPPQPQPPQFQPQPQPPQFQPQPQPPQIPQLPVQQPQPQPPQQIPQPQPPQFQPRPPQPQPPAPEETFDDAEVIEARRADSGLGRGSFGSYRSSRTGQHDFNFSF